MESIRLLPIFVLENLTDEPWKAFEVQLNLDISTTGQLKFLSFSNILEHFSVSLDFD